MIDRDAAHLDRCYETGRNEPLVIWAELARAALAETEGE